MNTRLMLFVMGLILTFAVPAFGTPRESRSMPAIPSNGVIGSGLNAVVNHTNAGGYELGRIDYSGSMQAVSARTWRSDARILMTAPDGTTFTIRPFTSGQTYTSANFSGSFFLPASTPSAGDWTFRFYEEIDDSGTGVDSTVTLNVTWTDEAPTPPAAIDTGIVLASRRTLPAVTMPFSGIQWYRLDLRQPIRRVARTFLDIEVHSVTLGPGSGSTFGRDTEIALYDSTGQLVVSDDDGGDAYLSQLSFGAPGRGVVGSSDPLDGQDGDLVPGVYYLAVGSYDLVCGPERWEAVPSVFPSGQVGIVISSNATPEYQLCPADWDGDSSVDSNDIIAFFADWENGEADFDFDQDSDSDDLVMFFEYWDSGC